MSRRPALLAPLYDENATFDESELQSARLLKIFLEWYPPIHTKSLFIYDKIKGNNGRLVYVKKIVINLVKQVEYVLIRM